MREVASRHAPAVRAVDPAAARAGRARLLVAAAEAAAAGGRPLRALGWRAAALALQPSRRLAREAAAAARDALRAPLAA
jgi:hypothetical protein